MAIGHSSDVVVEIEGQAPNLGDEAIQDLVLQMNEDGSAEFIDPSSRVRSSGRKYSHTANLAEILDDSVLGELSSDLLSKCEEDLESRAVKRLLPRVLVCLASTMKSVTSLAGEGVTHPISESVAVSITGMQMLPLAGRSC